jgi:hypothetical protein
LQLAEDPVNVTVTLLVCDNVTVPAALAVIATPKRQTTTMVANTDALKRIDLFIFFIFLYKNYNYI